MRHLRRKNLDSAPPVISIGAREGGFGIRNVSELLYQCISSSGVSGHICAFFSGILFAFGFAPYHLWPLSILSLCLYILGHKNLTPSQAAMRGFYFGLGQFGHGVSWLYVSLHEFAGQPLLLAASMTAFCIAVFSCFPLVQSYFYVKLHLNRKTLLGLPGLWVLFEWFRLKAFTGFPWLFVGYIFTDTPMGRGIAPLLGVFGLSFLGVFVAVLIIKITHSFSIKSCLRYGLAVGVVLFFSALLSFVDWTHVDKNRRPLHVTFIQGNIPQEEKWLENNIIPTQQKYQWLSQKALEVKENKPDIIIWPEAAITSFYQEAWQYMDRMDEIMLQHHAAWIFGISTFQAKTNELEFHNSIFSLGQGQGIYHKQKLVPFGEYIPFGDWFGRWLPFLNIPMSGYTPGSSHQFSLVAKGAHLAPFICYEILYPDFVRHYARSADFLLTISNDAWFGNSLAAYQHFEMARMRAMEQGKYLLRGTNTGITAIVDNRGYRVRQAPQFITAILSGDIYFTLGRTPFSLWGSTPILIFCAGVILFYLRQIRFENRGEKIQ